MKKYLLSTFLVLFCFSCSSLNKSYINAPVNVSSTVEVDADITLGNEITGTANSTSLFGLLTLNGLQNLQIMFLEVCLLQLLIMH